MRAKTDRESGLVLASMYGTVDRYQRALESRLDTRTCGDCGAVAMPQVYEDSTSVWACWVCSAGGCFVGDDDEVWFPGRGQ